MKKIIHQFLHSLFIVSEDKVVLVTKKFVSGLLSLELMKELAKKISNKGQDKSEEK